MVTFQGFYTDNITTSEQVLYSSHTRAPILENYLYHIVNKKWWFVLQKIVQNCNLY